VSYLCRNCGWVGERLAYDPLEIDERACPACLHSFDFITILPRRIKVFFSWREAYLKWDAPRFSADG